MEKYVKVQVLSKEEYIRRRNRGKEIVKKAKQKSWIQLDDEIKKLYKNNRRTLWNRGMKGRKSG